jgi:hypothetical protein
MCKRGELRAYVIYIELRHSEDGYLLVNEGAISEIAGFYMGRTSQAMILAAAGANLFLRVVAQVTSNQVAIPAAWCSSM